MLLYIYMPARLFLFFLTVFTFFILNSTFFKNPAFARITPEDIINSQKQSYNQKVASYLPENKQKLESVGQKIALINKKITEDWGQNSIRQGQILDELVRRGNLSGGDINDGVTRNSDNEVENARYWLTFAHEAVAYQAAKIYIINLTSEKNINSDINSSINQLEADLRVLKGKVAKSQSLIKSLVEKNPN